MKNKKINFTINVDGKKTNVVAPDFEWTRYQLDKIEEAMRILDTYAKVFSYLADGKPATRKEIVENAFSSADRERITLESSVQDKLTRMRANRVIEVEQRRIRGVVTWEDGTMTRTSKKISYYKLRKEEKE